MRPRVVDVAALAGVSPSSISNYFHRPNLVSAEAATRIRAAIEELGYVPNESARRLRSGNSKTMALMLLDAWIPFYAELSRGVEDVADANGWAVLFSNTGRNDYRNAICVCSRRRASAAFLWFRRAISTLSFARCEGAASPV